MHRTVKARNEWPPAISGDAEASAGDAAASVRLAAVKAVAGDWDHAVRCLETANAEAAFHLQSVLSENEERRVRAESKRPPVRLDRTDAEVRHRVHDLAHHLVAPPLPDVLPEREAEAVGEVAVGLLGHLLAVGGVLEFLLETLISEGRVHFDGTSLGVHRVAFGIE